MTRPIAFLLVLGLTATAGSAQAPTSAPLKIFLNEVQPGVMSAPQYCTLVFANRRFHSEKADIKQGRDTDRKIYEGQLSDNDWNALVAVIDSPGFRDLKVPQTVRRWSCKIPTLTPSALRETRTSRIWSS